MQRVFLFPSRYLRLLVFKLKKKKLFTHVPTNHTTHMFLPGVFAMYSIQFGGFMGLDL